MQSYLVLIVALSASIKPIKSNNDFIKFETHSSLPRSVRSFNINHHDTQKSELNSETGFSVFESNYFWNVSDKPVMSNGHVGFVPYGDSIFMNGLYNGHQDTAHRARIQNYANLQFDPCSKRVYDFGLASKLCSYGLDIYNGIFTTKATLLHDLLSIEHTQYAHRYYEKAIVNHIRMKRNQIDNNQKLHVQLSHHFGPSSKDLKIKSKRSTKILDKPVTIVEASTREIEDPRYQPYVANVTVLYERVPDKIELLPNQTEVEFLWITIVQQNSTDIEQLFQELHENHADLLKMHTNEWHGFWNEKRITVEGNTDLRNAIDASIFALASALPTLNSSQPRSLYYGICPAGLGLNRDLEVYLGHSFWDTEVWMLPSILLLQPKWSAELLNYRYALRAAAQDNANKTGYKGYRYPWESAYTGVDVTPESIYAENEQHITADIGYALRQHFFATHDFEWFRTVGCDLAYGLAQYWESRVQWNETTNRYDINHIMGPDEDHQDVNNNAFTNVAAALTLHFGSFASCFCNNLNPSKFPVNTEWASVAKKITLLHDQKRDYTPQFDGFNFNLTIKQADTVLLGYPMRFANMEKSTRRNNLILYSNLTRPNGPAMTWSMHAIGHLDVDPTPPEKQLFDRTYAPYIRRPFFVWNEVVDGFEGGASNFITGAGGFLQLIMYGYAGIRINADSLSIQQPKLPPDTTSMNLKGISYMQAQCEINLTEDDICIEIQGREKLSVFIDDTEQDTTQNIFKFKHDQVLLLKPKDRSFIESCSLPEDTVGHLNINPRAIEPHVYQIFKENSRE